jgi:hypothetical protein
MDLAFHREQMQKLRRTIHALLRVVEFESQVRRLEISTQMAVSYWYAYNSYMNSF